MDVVGCAATENNDQQTRVGREEVDRIGKRADLPKLVHQVSKSLGQFPIHAQRVVLVDV